MHVCCAPCFVAPHKHLKEAGHEVWAFWYNPNIHPFTENQKRLQSLQDFLAEENIPHIIKDEYKLEEFLRRSAYRESSRCQHCYYDRLKYTAIIAKKGNFDAFSSTLLYSKFQNHQLIKEIGNALAHDYGIAFFYEDFRNYWKEGIELSKQKNIYRQQYCGCIYSEKERYLGKDS